MRISKMLRCLLLFAICLMLSCKKEEKAASPSAQNLEGKFYSPDIELFWKVFDEIEPNFEQLAFKEKYVAKGSIGLKDFDELKDICPELEDKLNLDKYLTYYKSIRNNTLNLSETIAKAETYYKNFAEIYDSFMHADVYFLLGALTAGGKISENGILIAIEFFSKADTTDITELSEWYQSVLKEKKYLPSIVIHEVAHFQQQFAPQNNSYATLLEQSIREGMADYISYIILDNEPFLNEHIHSYADTIEQELWNSFKTEMDIDYRLTDAWLYNAGSTTNGVPADLGYYIGFKIVESYAANFNTNSEAINAMLKNVNYYTIFNESNYESKF